eukprot:s3212_g12.t1
MGLTDAAVEKWITRIKIPVVNVASLSFVSKRSASDRVLRAVPLLARVFRESRLHDELDMDAEPYVGSAGRIIKSFINEIRNMDKQHVFKLLCTPDCAAQLARMNFGTSSSRNIPD